VKDPQPDPQPGNMRTKVAVRGGLRGTGWPDESRPSRAVRRGDGRGLARGRLWCGTSARLRSPSRRLHWARQAASGAPGASASSAHGRERFATFGRSAHGWWAPHTYRQLIGSSALAVAGVPRGMSQ
jgi:hypothetical protein